MDCQRKINNYYRLCLVLILALLIDTTLAQQTFRLRSNQSATQQYVNEDIIAEIEFGQQVAAHVLGKIPLLEDETLNRYINMIGKTLGESSSRSELEFHFAVLDHEYANAYSAPGGYVFITLGAIKLASSEAELAAILAHEIAHVNSRHIVKDLRVRASDSSGLSGLVRFLGASSGTSQVAMGQAVEKAMSMLFKEGYNKEQELEADREAVLLLAASGYDPTALLQYLRQVAAQDRQLQSTTHPNSDQRLKTLVNHLKKEGLSTFGFHQGKQRFQRVLGRL